MSQLAFGILLFSFQAAYSQKTQVYLNGVIFKEHSIQTNLKVHPSLAGKYSKLSFNKIAFLFRNAQSLNLPHEFIKNCCFERGYRISQSFYSQGIKSIRVIALGKMKTLIDKWGFQVYWEKHTATALVDKLGDLWLIDTSLADQPLRLRDWLATFIEPDEKVELMMGNEFVFDMTDIISPLNYSNYSRAQVEEVVSGSLLGCQFVQDRNNKILRRPNSVTACEFLPQKLEHAKKNGVSDFWAQELIGLDLAREWLSIRRNLNLHRPLVHVWDEPVQKENQLNKDKINHANSVQSFFEPGPQAASSIAQIASHQDVIYDYRGYIHGSQNLRRLKETQLINLSAGWRSYVDSIKQSLDLVGHKNTLIVKAAGNRPVRASSEAEYEPERSDLIRVGSLAPNGLISEFSAVRGDWVIYAPSDRFLTAKASLKGDFTPFDGTSGAAPLVTGAVANLLSLNPVMQRQEVQDALLQTAFEFRDDSGLTHHYVVNAFRLLFVGMSADTYRQEVGLISANGLKAQNQLIELYPACFGIQPFLSQKSLQCDDQTKALKAFRRLYYLEPNKKMASALACIYKANGFLKESQFFSNWVASESGFLGSQITAQENSKSVLARNSRILSTSKLKEIFINDLKQDFEIKSDLGLALLLRPELMPNWVEDKLRGLKGNREKIKFIEMVLTVPGLRGDVLPKIIKSANDELAMTLLEVFYNTEDQELMAQMMSLIDRANDRIWMKMANFLDYYLPNVRFKIAKILIAKPSEDIQLRVLDFTNVMQAGELEIILKLAQKSQFASVRNIAQSFRHSRPRSAR